MIIPQVVHLLAEYEHIHSENTCPRLGVPKGAEGEGPRGQREKAQGGRGRRPKGAEGEGPRGQREKAQGGRGRGTRQGVLLRKQRCPLPDIVSVEDVPCAGVREKLPPEHTRNSDEKKEKSTQDGWSAQVAGPRWLVTPKMAGQAGQPRWLVNPRWLVRQVSPGGWSTQDGWSAQVAGQPWYSLSS